MLNEYRHRFDIKRRELVRVPITELITANDLLLKDLTGQLEQSLKISDVVGGESFSQFKENVSQLSTLLGKNIHKLKRWSDLNRHILFGTYGDISDILVHDWPTVRAGLRSSLYGEKEPIPVGVDDLAELVHDKPRGIVATKLNWERLVDEEFERLIFAIISSEPSYENLEWLTKTNAPDSGRDLSAYRVHSDPISGSHRVRLIIQCKHWQSKSVRPSDIATLREQLSTWEPPRVDVCVVATSGRFTTEAIRIIEQQNQSDRALRIEMWADSHLERILASKPHIIATFELR